MQPNTTSKAPGPHTRRQPRWRSRFDEGADAADPMASMGTLVDVMLVFACGLIAALVTGGAQLQKQEDSQQGRAIERGRELPDVPRGVGDDGSGYRSVGTVYRDPETGKLILIGSEGD